MKLKTDATTEKPTRPGTSEQGGSHGPRTAPPSCGYGAMRRFTQCCGYRVLFDPCGCTIRRMVKLITVVAVLYLVQPWQLVRAQDYQDRRITDLERRVASIDEMRVELGRIGERQQNLNARIDQLETLGRGIIIVVGAQLLLHGVSLKRKT